MSTNSLARLERGERSITDHTERQIDEALQNTFSEDQMAAFLEARRDAHIFASEDLNGDVTLNAGKLHFEILVTPPVFSTDDGTPQYWAFVVTPCASFTPLPSVIVSEDFRDSERSQYLSPVPIGAMNVVERIREAYHHYVTHAAEGNPIALAKDFARYDINEFPLTFNLMRHVIGTKSTASATVDENTEDRIRITVDTTRNGIPARYYWTAHNHRLLGWVTLQIGERSGAPNEYHMQTGEAIAVDPVQALRVLWQLKMRT